MAVTLTYQAEIIAGADTSLTQRVAARALETFSGTTGLTEGGARLVQLAAGTGQVAVGLGDVTNIRFLAIVPELDVIYRQIAGDTGERIAAGKLYLCEYSATGPPTALRLANTDAGNTNDVWLCLIGT
tara:strand:+ start:2368 stop:2751 length:384 start_codon:yes stop_codon:yes gene_type:complete